MTGVDPFTLDPHLAADVGSSTYIVEIFSGLVTLNHDLEVMPEIAASWDIDETGTVYTFHLRPDVRFHDGKSVTAQDFKWSFERALDPATASPVAGLYLNDIVGATDKLSGKTDEVEGIEVIDDHTLRITIDAPKAYFLAKLTYPTGFVLDRENVERGGSTWTNIPNGTGPFRLREYRPRERLVLERNPFYYGEPKPALDHVEFLLADGSRMTMYENGEIDATSVDLADIERVLDPSGRWFDQLTVVYTLSTFYVGLNNAIPPFDDPKVRQAFNYAVDRQTLANVVLRRTRLPAQGILPPRMPGYNPGLDVYDLDPEKAKQFIAESKYGAVENLPRITLTTFGVGVGTVARAVVEMLERNLGIDVSIEMVESATFLREVAESKYQMFTLGWIADYPDPQDFLEILFHSQSSYNYVNYANATVDQLLDAAATERDHDRRLQLYQAAERIILEDAPWIPLYHDAEYWLTKPYVKGMTYPPAVVPRLKYIWREK